MKVAIGTLIVLGSVGGSVAHAEDSVINPTPPPAYTLPWQLRSVVPAHAVRIDSGLAFFSDRNGVAGGFAAATVLSGSYKLIPELAFVGRLAMVNNGPPAGATAATSVVNPLLGAIYSLKIQDDFRLGFFFGFTLPVGMGSGNTPDASVQSANSSGILARSAMDNALFAVNYMTFIPGVDIAYIAHGFTAQFEMTLLQLFRIQGDQVDRDSVRTNLTSGLALGYALLPFMSAILEVRYQKWIYNPTVYSAAVPPSENLSMAIGPRFNFKVGTTTLRPGIAYAQGIVGPIASGGFTYPVNSQKIIFLDVPVSF